MKIAATILYGIAALVYLTGGILFSKNKTKSNNAIVLEILSFVASFVFTILLIASIVIQMH